MLIGGLARAQRVNAHAEARIVHHREHRGHAAMLLAHQPTGRAVILHHAGRAAMQAQLVLQRHDLERIGDAGIAVGIRQALGHEKQADPLGPLRRIGQARQNQVHRVVGEIVVTPGDVDLLAR
jgi:hypothetical protein